MNAPSAAPFDGPAVGKGAGCAAAKDTTLCAERPFPGLRPFTFKDRAFFFGRESQAFGLYRLVDGGQFIAVVGSSGSGKSSLVLAGLCDLLDQETQDPRGRPWIVRDMRPGGSPIRRLAESLSRILADQEPDVVRLADRIETRLRQSSFSLKSALDEAGGLNGKRMLLIVDQFEELFRFGLAGLGQHGAGLAEAKARDEASLFVQILLDARRVADVRVLITMRSDFIGDCAYFDGLPEAVSATQYLVPGLTRMQLEEVIRRPIEAAGGSIEPELVERLLNDCSEELDQLPVHQHCLMRMWDLAGKTAVDGKRRLTHQTYDGIGRMTDALSKHADEVLRECDGNELAVEQAFRALSELDREGRAIRRGRRFKTLLAETGVSESDLRDVLDKFRDPSCSFLVPSLPTPLGDDDVVDIGHEALLRRWKMLSGEGFKKTLRIDDIVADAKRQGLLRHWRRPGDEVKKASEAPPASQGWLVDERADGERYHTLLSLLEGEKASLTAPEETKCWWDSRPRTAAWAERYGGAFDSVKKLIDDSIEAKKQALEEERRSRRKLLLAKALVGAGVLVAGAAFWMMHQGELAQQAREERLRQEDVDKSAAKSVVNLLTEVLHAYNDKSLDAAAAESLASISGQFLNDTRKTAQTSAADLIWAQALNVEADLQAKLDRNREALDLAQKAKQAATPLIQSSPEAQEALQALYDSSIRAGDAYSRMDRAHKDEALREYRNAIALAEKIAAVGGDAGDHDVTDAHLKIGDVDEDNGLKPDSEAEYRSGLKACEAALVRHPQSFQLMRDKGAAFVRIADLLTTEGSFENARHYYGEAAGIQQALIERNNREALGAREPPDPSLKSNLAATHTHWGRLENKAGNPELALRELEKGAAIDQELIKNQPGNLQWEAFAAGVYEDLADILTRLNRPQEALDALRKEVDARRTLSFRGFGPAKARKEFADASKRLGDHASGLAQIDAYGTVVRVWTRLADDPDMAEAAASEYDAILSIANRLNAKKDWADAQAAYRLVSKLATLNLTKDPSNTVWRDNAENAQKAVVEAQAAMAAETASSSP